MIHHLLQKINSIQQKLLNWRHKPLAFSLQFQDFGQQNPRSIYPSLKHFWRHPWYRWLGQGLNAGSKSRNAVTYMYVLINIYIYIYIIQYIYMYTFSHMSSNMSCSLDFTGIFQMDGKWNASVLPSARVRSPPFRHRASNAALAQGAKSKILGKELITKRHSHPQRGHDKKRFEHISIWYRIHRIFVFEIVARNNPVTHPCRFYFRKLCRSLRHWHTSESQSQVPIRHCHLHQGPRETGDFLRFIDRSRGPASLWVSEST